MRRSNYFMPTIKENPSEAKIVSHRLMLRSGMIRQSSSGIYSWLPLGLRVLKRSAHFRRDHVRRTHHRRSRPRALHELSQVLDRAQAL